MIEQNLLVHQEREKRQSSFIQRYERLLAWAVQISSQHVAGAEDLVHDAFIRFVLAKTSIEEIENLDGYLRSMLRYLYLTNRLRFDQRTLDGAISLSDCDSFALGCRNIDPGRRMQVREELWQVCVYACSRKAVSRTGAVLILRFFHNYRPAEIAQLLCVSRHNIDQLLSLARKELKQFFSRYLGKFGSIGLDVERARSVTCNSLRTLQELIFASPAGDCLQFADLQTIYFRESMELPTAQLAHLVSCRDCLDQTNQFLELPLLSERAC